MPLLPDPLVVIALQVRAQLRYGRQPLPSYSYARCEQAQSACVKYVTDGADHAADEDWITNLSRAAAQFLECYRRLTLTA